MAESQDLFPYDSQLLDALNGALSPSRLGPYLASAKGDRLFAIKIYLWNARLAKSFLYPLHVAEVTIRNAMHNAFSQAFGGPGWILNIPFQFNFESANSYSRSVKRLHDGGKQNPSPDEVIASLSFDFWSNLFRRDYKSLWGKHVVLQSVFPNLPETSGRGDIKDLVAGINRFRNRIAHHEPIFRDVKHHEMHDKILDLIGLRCQATKDWVRRHSTVMAVVRSPPTPASTLPGRPLASANLRPPPILQPTDTLLKAMGMVAKARPAVALLPDTTRTPPYSVVTAPMLLGFIERKSAELGDLIELGAHTVQDIISTSEPVLCATIDRIATTGDAAAQFFPPDTKQSARPQVLIVLDDSAPQRVAGVILRSEIRY